MRILFRRILTFDLVAARFFTNINISVAASGIGEREFLPDGKMNRKIPDR